MHAIATEPAASAPATAAPKPRPPISTKRRLLLAAISIAVGAAIWLPCVHFLFRPNLSAWRSDTGIAPNARRLANWHLRIWTDPQLKAAEIRKMRHNNAEWDFMGRTFFVLALANMSIREPAEADRYLGVIDTIIDETLALEKEQGMYVFLMDYARESPYHVQPPHSIFVDGEIALMIAARRMVRDDRPGYCYELHQRIDKMVDTMERGHGWLSESYPNECWIFDNVIALVSMKMADRLDGTDHSRLINRWLEHAKMDLTDEKTHLLISCAGVNGARVGGVEGSTIWMTAHCLSLFDETFAYSQYCHARLQLSRSFLGFGYAREWPRGVANEDDVDSGPTVPFFEANAGSSGLALVAAASFHDDKYLRSLLASLNAAACPVRDGDTLHYAASNQVGDAVLLYAMVQGPLWEKVRGK